MAMFPNNVTGPAGTTGRARWYIGTFNNFDTTPLKGLDYEDDMDTDEKLENRKQYLVRMFKELDNISYAYVAAEHWTDPGPEETPHLQFVLWFDKQVSKKTVNAQLQNKCWLGPVNGKSWEMAVNYCKKGDQPKEEWTELNSKGPNWGKNLHQLCEFGKTPNPGARADIAEVAQLLGNGSSLKKVAIEFPEVFIKYSTGLMRYEEIASKKRHMDDDLTVIVRYGLTGTGKTYSVMREHYGDDDFYHFSPGQGTWFNNYVNQSIVLFDEFRGSTMSYSLLLSCLDTYGLRVQVKGGMAHFRPSTVYITSPVHPAAWYPKRLNADDGLIQQLKRRITKIEYFDKPWDPRTGAPMPAVADHTNLDWQPIITAALTNAGDGPSNGGVDLGQFQ